MYHQGGLRGWRRDVVRDGRRRRRAGLRRGVVALAGRRDGFQVLRGFDKAVRRVVREGRRHEGERGLLVDEVGPRPLVVCGRARTAPRRCKMARVRGKGRESPRIGAHALHPRDATRVCRTIVLVKTLLLTSMSTLLFDEDIDTWQLKLESNYNTPMQWL